MTSSKRRAGGQGEGCSSLNASHTLASTSLKQSGYLFRINGGSRGHLGRSLLREAQPFAANYGRLRSESRKEVSSRRTSSLWIPISGLRWSLPK